MGRAEQVKKLSLQGPVPDPRQGGNSFGIEKPVSHIEKGEEFFNKRRVFEVSQSCDCLGPDRGTSVLQALHQDGERAGVGECPEDLHCNRLYVLFRPGGAIEKRREHLFPADLAEGV
jgi:hypothetical protein